MRLKYIVLSLLIMIGITACSPEQQQIWSQLSPVQQQQFLSAVNPTRSHRELGRQMAYAKGYSESQFVCLDNVINRESAWRNIPNAAGGSAYGIPQALGKSHPETRNALWRNSPPLQISWLLSYVSGRYGDACKAWSYKQKTGWY